MKIECEVTTKAETSMGTPKRVKVSLEGDYDALVALLQKYGFDPSAADAPKIE
jgi:hypothetical protein